jgi:beta-lactamase class A
VDAGLAGRAGFARVRALYARETRRAGGNWFSLVTAGQRTIIEDEPDTEILAASVNKLAMALALMDKIDRGEARLDQKVELTADVISSGPGSSGMWHLQKIYGDNLTLANVIVTLLIASEDSALPLIARVVPRPELNAILERKGFAVTRVSEDSSDPNRFFHGPTTPREMHRLLTGLAAGTLLSKESSDYLLTIMRWSEPGYTDGVRRLMSSEERSRVANKYGAYQDRRHEVGIMFGRNGAPALTYTFFARDLGDTENYGATNPAVQARSVLGRAMLDAVDRR